MLPRRPRTGLARRALSRWRRPRVAAVPAVDEPSVSAAVDRATTAVCNAATSFVSSTFRKGAVDARLDDDAKPAMAAERAAAASEKAAAVAAAAMDRAKAAMERVGRSAPVVPTAAASAAATPPPKEGSSASKKGKAEREGGKAAKGDREPLQQAQQRDKSPASDRSSDGRTPKGERGSKGHKKRDKPQAR
eukprot:1638754-Prymnesium_polylepis.2